jgi:hypothetical protein
LIHPVLFSVIDTLTFLSDIFPGQPNCHLVVHDSAHSITDTLEELVKIVCEIDEKTSGAGVLFARPGAFLAGSDLCETQQSAIIGRYGAPLDCRGARFKT